MRLLFLAGAASLALALTTHAQTAPPPAAPVAGLAPCPVTLARPAPFDFNQVASPAAPLVATPAPRVDAVVTSAADARAMLHYALTDSLPTAPKAAPYFIPKALTAHQFRHYLRRGRRYLRRYQRRQELVAKRRGHALAFGRLRLGLSSSWPKGYSE